ncbi:hypothetical protein L596_012674 [Steinernema carpocapsae]|nr:hypothetical protein L596_012674 [Steinernema carpocapsae]
MSPNVWSEAISFVILRNDELICPNNFTQIVISRGGSNNDDRERHDDLIQVPLQIGQIPNTDDRPPAPLDNNRQWIWNDLEERWKPNKGPDMKYINGQWIEIP